MRTYKCLFFSRDHKFFSSNITCVNYDELLSFLKSLGLSLISAKRIFLVGYSNNYRDIYEWFELLGSLLVDGFKLDEALLVISKTKKYSFSEFMCQMLNAGYSFPSIISRYAYFFTDRCVEMVKNLSEALNIFDVCTFVAKYYKKLWDNHCLLKTKVMPLFFNVVLSLLLTILLIWLIKDEILSICLAFNISLPLPIKFAFLCRDHVFIVFIVFCLKLFICRYLIRFTAMYNSRELYFFFTYIADSIASGIHIIPTLDMFISNTGSLNLKAIAIHLRLRLLSGCSLSESFDGLKQLRCYSRLLYIAEETSSLVETFRSIAAKENAKYNDSFEFLSFILPKFIYIANTLLVVWVFGSILSSLYVSISLNL